MVRVTEDELPMVLKLFENMDVVVSFEGDVSEHLTFHNIKTEIKNFEVIVYDIGMTDFFKIKLYDIYEIEKSEDNKILCLFSETLGKICIYFLKKN